MPQVEASQNLEGQGHNAVYYVLQQICNATGGGVTCNTTGGGVTCNATGGGVTKHLINQISKFP